MDMSFANQALAADFIIKNKGKLIMQVLPEVIDENRHHKIESLE